MSSLSFNDGDIFCFKWIIEDFSYKSKLIISPDFVAETLHQTKWCIQLVPKDEGSEKSMKVSLFRKNDNGPSSCSIGFEIGIISAFGSLVLQTRRSYHAFIKMSNSEWDEVWNREGLLSKKDFYLPCNSLTIQCRLWTCSTIEPVYNRCTGITYSELEKVCIEKNIKNFSACYSGHRVTIPIPVKGQFELILRLEKSAFGDVLVCDVRKNGEYQHNHLFCKLSFLNVYGIPKLSKEQEHLFEGKQEFTWCFAAFSEFECLKKDTSEFLKNDTLAFKCEVAVWCCEEKSRIIEKSFVPVGEIAADKVTLLKSLGDNLLAAYTDKKYTDVELRIGKKSLPANRFLLSARSNVFETMLKNSDKKQINISDVNIETMDKFLKFLYSASLEELSFKAAAELFTVANRFKVFDLKETCLCVLRRDITPETVCDVMRVGVACQDEDLKTFAEEYFCQHSCEILNSDSWQNVIDNEVRLATTLLRKLSTKYN